MNVIQVVVCGIALFVFPGYALLVAFGLHREFDLVEMVSAAVGLSIGAVPLALYTATLLGLRLAAPSAIGLLVLPAICVVYDAYRRYRIWRSAGVQRIPVHTVLLTLVVLTALGARLWMVRGVEYPLWTDSYHHTVITQLIADSGMVPDSYRPYSEIDRFTYHFGFHAIAAWYHWISGLVVPRAVVVVGQIINTIAVPTAYLLARRLYKSPVAGLVTATVVGLVSHMPALFVNWGRYTQLSGQVLAPVIMTVWLMSVRTRQGPWRWSVFLGLGAALQFMIHIRVFLFLCLFFGVATLFEVLDSSEERLMARLRMVFLRLAVIGLVGLLVSLPWLMRFMDGFGSRVVDFVGEGYQVADRAYFGWQWSYFTDYGMRLALWILAAIGLLWGLLRRNLAVSSIGVWFAAMLAAANAHRLGLYPLFSNLVVSKFHYLPVALLIGYGGAELASVYSAWGLTHRRGSRLVRAFLILVLLGSCAWGFLNTVDLIEPENGFVRQADLEAALWVEEHTSPDALFYVSTSFWTPLIAHGLDGGYWLPYLAHRDTILPVQLYGSDGSPELVGLVRDRALALLSADTPQSLQRVMREYAVTHVYIGARPSNLHPEFFLEDPEHFELLYARDGVWVFGLR